MLEAAFKGDEGVIHRLIKDQANASLIRNTDGRTLLHRAAYWGHTTLVYKLVNEYNLAVDEKTTANETPLMDAVFKGHYDIVQFLLSSGASVHHRNNYNETPLEMANKFQKPEIAELLKQHGAQE